MRLIGYLCLWIVILFVLFFLLATREVKLTTSLGVATLVLAGFVSLGFVFLKGYQRLAFLVLLIGLAVVSRSVIIDVAQILAHFILYLLRNL